MAFLSRIDAQPIINRSVLENAILIQESEINTETYEYAPVFYGPYLAFVNDRKNSNKYDHIKNTPYFDISFAGANLEGNLAKQATFSANISSSEQEGPFCFSPDQDLILFTRADPQTGKLAIYQARLNDGTWDNISKTSLLSEDFHYCHPSISSSGNLLVFAAAGPEATHMDLYLSRRTNESWSVPVKLPNEINSLSNDWFPRFVGDSVIMYASDRPSSFGGLDIYATKWQRGIWTKPELLGSPINSESDDMGLIIGDEIAYFSSNRKGGNGKDDLYRIEYKGNLLFNPSIAIIEIDIQIKDKLTLENIPGAQLKAIPVIISDKEEDPIFFDIDLASETFEDDAIILRLKPKETLPTVDLTADNNGVIKLNVTRNQRYAFGLSAPGYNDYAALYLLSDYGDELTYVLEPTEDNLPDGYGRNSKGENVIIPTTAGSTVVFDQIYYDFNSHIISRGAASELDAMVITMNQNPEMVIRLSAHTDSRGTSVYNQRLSEKRAQAAKNYLVKKGISADRIETVGYGEKQLRNNCGDNVPCAEEDHKFNRRTEVLIISN